jgi:Kef-type K+ transport system membrane component KefB
VLLSGPVHLAADAAASIDPAASVALRLAMLLVAAKLGGDVATRIGQPAVLGEITIGIALGNLSLLGISGLEPIEHDMFIDLLAHLGALLLLFEIGLESTVGEMLKVGGSSVLVATLGVAAPFALGWFLGGVLLPEQGIYVHAFLGATLSATSVGITARVLQELGCKRKEARIILGAAVIDDVLGLVILTVVSATIQTADRGGHLSFVSVGTTVLRALAFLVGSLVIGIKLSPRLFALLSKMQTRGVLLAAGLAFCFFLAWVANWIGLAPIVGAFAAGLILEDAHYREFMKRGEQGLEELVHPIAAFLVPIFFTLMGMRTDLTALMQPGVLALAAALTLAAIIGKQACALGVLGGGVDRLTVGIGMVPRGEVGLIFANVGLTLSIQGRPILDQSTYAAVLVMVVVTTMITPPALKWSLSRISPAENELATSPRGP